MSDAPHKNRREGLPAERGHLLLRAPRIFLGAITFLLAGCTAFSQLTVPPETPPPVREHSDVELASELTQEELKSGGLAVLAVLTTNAPEGFQQNAAYELFQGLRASFPQVRIIPRSDAVDKIVAAEKLQEYKAFVREYPERRRIGLVDGKKWGDIQGVRYLFIGAVDVADKHTDARMLQGGESGVGGKISVFASGPGMVPEEVRKLVSLRGEIWDSRCGRAVWIGKGEAEVVEEVGKELVRMEDIFISAARTLTRSLAKTVVEKPVSVVKGC